MDSRQLNDVQIITYVGQLLLLQRIHELGSAARSDERVVEQLASTLRQAPVLHNKYIRSEFVTSYHAVGRGLSGVLTEYSEKI